MRKLLTIISAISMATLSYSATPLTTGITKTNLNESVVPGNDFYQFACGGWMKSNPLTGEYSRFGTFDQLRENNLKQLNGLITDLARKGGAQGTIEQKIADLYNIALDSAKLNKEGYAPIKSELKRIGSLKSKTELLNLIPQLYLNGLDTYFAIAVEADQMSSKENLVQTYQSGLGLGQRDYYLENDARTKEIRDKYKQHIINMFKLVGFTDKAAKANMVAIMTIETRLAKASYDKVKLRDPNANYNKMSVAKLQKLVPQINWNAYLTALGLKNTKQLSVSQKEALVEVGKVIE